MDFSGKKGVVIGVANENSIAWAIAKQILEGGGEIGFSHLPDRPDDERKKNRLRVSKLTDQYENAKFLLPMDAQNDESISAFFSHVGDTFGKIDFLLHSIAFADRADLNRDTIHTSRDGFKLAMDVSAYSLIAFCNAAKDLFNPGAAVAAMSYFGGEKIVPGYNVMGICKAALEATVRYMAFDLGARDVRVNALSAGPVRTLAGRAAGVDAMLKLYDQMSPMARNVSIDEVGAAGAFLLHPASSGVSGDILHVDCGYHAMGSPGRLLDQLKE